MQKNQLPQFEQLVETYSGYVYSLARRILVNADDAADATQETFLKLYQNAERYDGRREIQNWICTIALNTARDIYRKRKRLRNEIEYDDHADAHNAGQTGRRPDTKILAAELLATLPVNQRMAMVLFYIEQRTVKEIAEILRRPEVLVKVWLHRARAALLRNFGDDTL